MNRLIISALALFFATKGYSQLTPSTIGEVFNYEIGDTFEYHLDVTSMTGNPDCSKSETTMLIVLNKQSGNDAYYYLMKRIFKSSWQCYYMFGGGDSSVSVYNTEVNNLDSSVFTLLDTSAQQLHPYTPIRFCNGPVCHVDTVYRDPFLHNRKINKHWTGIPFWIQSATSYAEGLGVLSRWSIHEDFEYEQSSYNLIYYHKANGEKWGSPHYFTVTSVEDNRTNDQHISIMPNPAINEFQIRFSDPLTQPNQFRLYDSLGKMVLDQEITQDASQVICDHLEPGLYFWEIYSNNITHERGKIILR